MDGRFLLPGTVKQGYLTKSPPLDKGTSVFKGWKKRWCILYLSQRELFIQYYENEESARGSSPPKSTVSLRFCEKVDVDLEHSSYKNVFGIHLPERVYYFSAPSNFEMNEWVDAICTHLNLRDQSEPHNLYSTGLSNTLPASSHYGTTSSTLGGGISPPPPSMVYPSQYGTLSAIHMGTTNVSAGLYSTGGRGAPPSPPTPYTGNLLNNGNISSPYGIFSPPQPQQSVSPPSPTFSSTRIQQRSLPPVPSSGSSLDIPPSVPPRKNALLEDEDDEPPIPPPRQASTLPNVYVTTPTR